MAFTVQLHHNQTEFHMSRALYRGFSGGIGSGKSFVGALDMLIRAASIKGMYGIYAPTYKMLNDASMISFMKVGGADGCGFVKEYVETKGIARLQNGSIILCRSLEDYERARGPSLLGAWIDEGSLLDKEAVDIVIGRLRSGTELGWLTCTFTPKGREHWTFRMFGTGAKSAACFFSRTKDNPFIHKDFTNIVRREYTEYYARQELDGEFVEAENAACKREWFQKVHSTPAVEGALCRSWDFAASVKERSDYTVGTLLERNEGKWYVRDVKRVKISAGDVEDFVFDTAMRDGMHVHVVLEQECGASGKIVGSNIVKRLAGWMVKMIRPGGDKMRRIMPFLAQAQHGNVYIVRNAWNEDWLAEFCMFPEGKHDDQVDSVSLGFIYLSSNSLGGAARLARNWSL